MSIVVVRSFGVNAAAEAVLDYLRDFRNTEEWDPATRRSERIDAGPIGVGSRWRNESRVLGVTSELMYTLCHAETDRLVFIGRNETATATGTFTVVPIPPGSHITYHLDLEMHGVAKLATPVVKAEFEKLGNQSAVRLAQVLQPALET